MWNSQTVEWLDVELTSFCNISCPGCLRQVKNKTVKNILNKDILTLKQIKKWITSDILPNLKLVNFCGSIDEPTIHPEILDIVRYFKTFSSDINISSNGSTKTENFWSRLGEEKISVFFGIDGIDQKSLEKYRVGSNYKKIEKNWKAFIASGGHATWQFIVFDHNDHLIEEARKIANEEGFKQFRLIHSHRDGNNEKKQKIKSEEQQVVCKYLNQKRLFLSHTGVLLPCCFFNSEFLQVHAGGGVETRFTNKFKEYGGLLTTNLKYNHIEEVIDGDLFRYIINSWENDPVERCWKTCKKSKQDIFEDERLN